jgi:hypothetical protein
MATQFIVGIAAFVCALACALTASVTVWAMVDEVKDVAGTATVLASMVVLVQISKAKPRIQKILSERKASAEISGSNGADVCLRINLRLGSRIFQSVKNPSARSINKVSHLLAL